MTYTPLRMMILGYGIASCALLNAHQSLKTDYWTSAITAQKQGADIVQAFNACDATTAAQEVTDLKQNYEKQHELVEHYEAMTPQERIQVYQNLCAIYQAMQPSTIDAAKEALGAATSWLKSVIGKADAPATPAQTPVVPNPDLLERLKYDIAALDELGTSGSSLRTVTIANWQPYHYDVYINHLADKDNIRWEIEKSWAKYDDNKLENLLLIDMKQTLDQESAAIQTERGQRKFEKSLKGRDAAVLQEQEKTYATLIAKLKKQNTNNRLDEHIRLFEIKQAAVQKVLAAKNGHSVTKNSTTSTTQSPQTQTPSTGNGTNTGGSTGGTQQTAGQGQSHSSATNYMPVIRKYAPATAAAAVCAGVAIALYIKYTDDSDDIDADEEYTPAIAVYRSSPTDASVQLEDEIAAA